MKRVAWLRLLAFERREPSEAAIMSLCKLTNWLVGWLPPVVTNCSEEVTLREVRVLLPDGRKLFFSLARNTLDIFREIVI